MVTIAYLYHAGLPRYIFYIFSCLTVSHAFLGCASQMISDESRHVLFECQKVCGGGGSSGKSRHNGSSPGATLTQQQMAATWDALNANITHMQVRAQGNERERGEGEDSMEVGWSIRSA